MEERREAVELLAVMSDLRAFIKGCSIEHPGRGAVQAELLPHLEELSLLVMEDGEGWNGVREPRWNLVLLKARQVYISWWMSMVAAWRGMYYGGRVLVYSRGEREAQEFLRKIKFVVRTLPGHLRLEELGQDNKTEMEFVGGGRITSLPSTPEAGRGEHASLVIVDEAAFHPYPGENFTVYKPAISDPPRGQAIIASTAWRDVGFFADMWKRGGESWRIPGLDYEDEPEEVDSYRRMFIPWNPPGMKGRDEEWYAREQHDYAGLPEMFRREYPSTPSEAFTAFQGLVFEGWSDAKHGVSEDPVEWTAYARRYAGIDPGGSDPTAIVLVGQTQEGHFHVHDLLYDRGVVSVSEIVARLQDYHESGAFDVVVGDFGKSSPWVHELRRSGLPAIGARKDPRLRRALIAQLLQQERLTVNQVKAPELIHEFKSTYWRDGSGMNAVTTDGRHHADGLDALGYLLQEGQPQRVARAVEKTQVNWGGGGGARRRPQSAEEAWEYGRKLLRDQVHDIELERVL